MTNNSQSYKLKNSPKLYFLNFEKKISTPDTPSNLLDNNCKYQMVPESIIEVTERTRFSSQTDRRTDKIKPVYPPFNFAEMGV